MCKPVEPTIIWFVDAVFGYKEITKVTNTADTKELCKNLWRKKSLTDYLS